MRNRQPSDRRIVRRFLSRWYQRPFWLGVVLLGAVVAGRIALTPFVDDWARSTLANLPHHRGTYRDLSIFTWPPIVVLSDVQISDRDGQPVLSVPRLEVHVMRWRDVIRGVVAGTWPHPSPRVRVRLVEPWLTVRSGTSDELKARVQEIVAETPSAHVEVAGVERGRVTVAPQGSQPARDCVTDLAATFQHIDLGDPDAASIDPRSPEAFARSQPFVSSVPVDKLCAGAAKAVQIRPDSLSRIESETSGEGGRSDYLAGVGRLGSGAPPAGVTNW